MNRIFVPPAGPGRPGPRAICVLRSPVLAVIVAVSLAGCGGAPWKRGQDPREAMALRAEDQADARPCRRDEPGADRLALARELVARGHYPVAQVQLREWLARNDGDPEAHHLLGVCRREGGDAAGAVAAFETAIAHDPDYAPAYDGMGIALSLLDCGPRALAAFEKAVALNPARPDFLNNLGMTLMNDGRLAEAGQAFERGLALDRGAARIRNNLAACLGLQGRTREALALLRGGGLDEAVALNNLGAIELRAGRPEAARLLFERALARDPDLGAARRNLQRLDGVRIEASDMRITRSTAAGDGGDKEERP